MRIALRTSAVLGLALALGLAGCSTTPAPTASSVAPAPALRAIDMWAKATDTDMTGLFGTLENPGDAPVHVVSATSPSAPMVQLHETVKDASGNMVMRETAAGFTVPAHGSFVLEPGANHIMLMGLTTPLRPGDEAKVVLTLEGGGTVEFGAVVKSYSGANESYHQGAH